MEGRINRLNQYSPEIRIITLHAGILSYLHNRYEKTRNLSEAVRGFSKDIGIEYKQLIGLL